MLRNSDSSFIGYGKGSSNVARPVKVPIDGVVFNPRSKGNVLKGQASTFNFSFEDIFHGPIIDKSHRKVNAKSEQILSSLETKRSSAHPHQ